MDNALIVSGPDKGTALLTALLNAASIQRITVLPSCGEARRLLLERDFDLVIANDPLRDESGESFARHVASKSMSQVILIVNNEHFDAVSAICEDDGVLTVSKPLNNVIVWSALTLAKSACNRLRRMQAENERLKRKIGDIRLVDRAKWILVSTMGLSEQEAHRYIEKRAMDMRSTKRSIAEGILKTYDN